MALELDSWSLDKWLRKIRMSKYKQDFIDNGYETPELCAELNKEALDAMEVTNKHHRSTLFTQSRKLLKLVDKDRYLALDGEETEEPQASVAPGKLQPVDNKDPNSLGIEHSPTSPNISSQPGLSDYSEPWSGGGNASPAGANASPPKPVKRVLSGSRGDSTDGPSPSHKNIPQKKPPSPGGMNDSSTKKDTSTGMTRLQFKLKIREELFHRNVVLSEAPYCREDGTPDEKLILELAIELSDKFEMKSQTMCDALKEEWSNANKCAYNPTPVTPKFKSQVPVVASKSLDNYDEPFDTTNPASPKVATPSHRPLGNKVSAASADNYDEPFDTTNPAVLAVPPMHYSPGKKSATMPPSSAAGDLSNYDEPFDTLPNKSSSPEKTREAQLKMKESSKTLPSPRHQRKELSSDHGGSPHNSPARSKKFNLFKKKEKKDKKPRTMSLQESDVQFIDDKNKDSSHGLVVTFATKSKGTSAEDVSGVHISPSSEQLSFLQKGQPPPLPSPRLKLGNGSSGDSDESPQLSGQSKRHGGAVFRRFITPRKNLTGAEDHTQANGIRVAKIRISRGSDDEDGAEWLNGSKSFEELSNFKDEMDPRRVVTRQKKSRTSKLIARIFKRKTMTPGSLKQSQVGGSTMMVNRCSRVGDESSVDRERSLTTSVSMPDITISRDDATFKSSSHLLHDYIEIEDSRPHSYKGEEEHVEEDGSLKKVIKVSEVANQLKKKKPPKPPRKSPRPSPCHSPSPTLSRSSVTSPPISISPSSHRQVVIRGVSESSTPDQMTIPIIQPSSAPSMLFEASGSQSFSEENSVQPFKPCDPTSNSSTRDDETYPSSVLSRTPPLMTKSSQGEEDEPKRLGSVSSTASDGSVGSSSKPAVKPKPPVLAGKRPTKGQVRPIKSTTLGPVVAPSPKNKNENRVSSPPPENNNTSPATGPPPKPARTLPRKSRLSGDLSDSSSTTTSPSRTSFEQDGGDGKFSISPSHMDSSGQRHSYSASSTPPLSPLSPLSPNTLSSARTPPPKPARRARSLKDVSDSKGSTVPAKEGSQPTADNSSSKPSQPAPDYSTATLPSKFKPVSAQSPSTPPKPIPRTRRT